MRGVTMVGGECISLIEADEIKHVNNVRFDATETSRALAIRSQWCNMS